MLADPKPIDNVDIIEIQSWFQKRGFPIPENWFFPSEGLMIPEIAAGFLYLTNSGVAYIDGYISNPDSKVMDRMQAFRKITEGLLWMSKNIYDVKMLCCNTKHNSIRRMALSFGFTDTGSHMSFNKVLND